MVERLTRSPLQISHNGPLWDTAPALRAASELLAAEVS